MRTHDRQPPAVGIVVNTKHSERIVLAGFNQQMQRFVGHFGYHHHL